MKKIILVIIITFFIAGCSSIVKPEQSGVVDTTLLSNQVSIGQTFVAHYDGLNGFEIYFEPITPGNGKISLYLQKDTFEFETICSGGIDLSEITTAGFYSITFFPQNDSFQKDYYFVMELEGDGIVKVGKAPGDSYLNGALYQNNEPEDAQVAFKLMYEPQFLAVGLVKEVATWGWYLLVAAFLFVIPGWALLSYLYSGWNKQDWVSKLALSVGVSLAVYPLLFLWTDVVGLQLGALYAWLPPMMGVIFLIFQQRKEIREIKIKKAIQSLNTPNIALLFIIITIFIFRFWVIRSIKYPMWMDSHQHTLYTQLLLDNNGLFKSWAPYAPYHSLTTHFGFSTFAALFSWITGLESARATIWMGQLLNGLAIITIYPIALKISAGNKWAGIGALISAGFISQTPAIFVNWGRYAQLAGQVVLPVSIWFLWEVIEQDYKSIRIKLRNIFLAGLSLSGMALTYYRMPFFYFFFFIALLLCWGFPKWRNNRKCWIKAISNFGFIGLYGALFLLPWGIRLLESKSINSLKPVGTYAASIPVIVGQLKSLLGLHNFVSILLILMSAIALFWGGIRKNWLLISMPLWFALLVLYRTLAFFRFPGAHMFNAFSIMIAAYIPISVLAGWAFNEMGKTITKQKGYLNNFLVSGIILASVIWFGARLCLLIDPDGQSLVTIPDEKAM